jgi:hypothetical protein
MRVRDGENIVVGCSRGLDTTGAVDPAAVQDPRDNGSFGREGGGMKTTTTTGGGWLVVGGFVLGVARMRHDDLDGGAVESHGVCGGTAAAAYGTFCRMAIHHRAAAAAGRWDVQVDVDVDNAKSSSTTNATTANGGKWLRIVDVVIDKGLDDNNNWDDGSSDSDGG